MDFSESLYGYDVISPDDYMPGLYATYNPYNPSKLADPSSDVTFENGPLIRTRAQPKKPDFIQQRIKETENEIALANKIKKIEDYIEYFKSNTSTAAAQQVPAPATSTAQAPSAQQEPAQQEKSGFFGGGKSHFEFFVILFIFIFVICAVQYLHMQSMSTLIAKLAPNIV